MNETIDQAEVLPRNVVFVTPERLVKGDIKVAYNDNGQLVEAKAIVKNILNFMWESDIIDDQKYHDAGTYQIWRDMHQCQFGLRKPISSGGEEAIGCRLRAYGYILLVKRLNRFDLHNIELVIETNATEHTKNAVRINKRIYQLALQNLSAIIPPIKEQINYLENLDESESHQLSEENLKKLLEQFIKTS